jgi:hypothetical protein
MVKFTTMTSCILIFRGALDLVETAKAHIRGKVEHPFRVIKEQFGLERPDCAEWPTSTEKSIF